MCVVLHHKHQNFLTDRRRIPAYTSPIAASNKYGYAHIDSYGCEKYIFITGGSSAIPGILWVLYCVKHVPMQ